MEFEEAARMTTLANERVAWFNGKIVPEHEVRISFRDSSWLYGDGAFDMTRTFEGAPFRHIAPHRPRSPFRV